MAVEEQQIIEAFPEMAEIKDEKLRDGVVKTWKSALDMGGWENIRDIPFTLLLEDVGTLVDHTRRVTRMAMAVCDTRGDLNRDLVIAGALLHDVGKPVEYAVKEGKVVKGRLGKLLRHPVSGAALAMKNGLPVEVAHIIAAHSKEGEFVDRIPEAVVINHCDFIDFDIAKSRKKWE